MDHAVSVTLGFEYLTAANGALALQPPFHIATAVYFIAALRQEHT